MRSASDDIEKALVQRTQWRFDDVGSHGGIGGTAPDGTRWRPVKRKSLLARGQYRSGEKKGRKRFKTRGYIRNENAILKDSGRLQRSIRRIKGTLAVGISTPTGASMYLGTKVPYGRIHQRGGRSRFGFIPKRRFLGVSTGDANRVLTIVKKEVERAIK